MVRSGPGLVDEVEGRLGDAAEVAEPGPPDRVQVVLQSVVGIGLDQQEGPLRASVW